jgi:hypothetical protein
MEGKRYRLTSDSGQEFTLVNRKERGWAVDLKLPGHARIRKLIGHGSREEIAPTAIQAVEELLRTISVAERPTLVRVGAEMLVFKREKQAQAFNYRRMIECHLRLYLVEEFGTDT